MEKKSRSAKRITIKYPKRKTKEKVEFWDNVKVPEKIKVSFYTRKTKKQKERNKVKIETYQRCAKGRIRKKVMVRGHYRSLPKN